jgi:hypothetical protein
MSCPVEMATVALPIVITHKINPIIGILMQWSARSAVRSWREGGDRVERGGFHETVVVNGCGVSSKPI